MFDFSAMLSLRMLAGLSLLAAAACAPMNSASNGGPSPNGVQSTVDAIGESNGAVYSNSLFTRNATPVVRDGFSGSTMPPSGGPLFTGTETYPPGALGPEAPGSQASGSMLGPTGGF